MKQYVIDEIRPQDFEKVKGYLDETYGAAGLNGLYWVPVDEALLSGVQQAHHACSPFFIALELGPDRLAAEIDFVLPKNLAKVRLLHLDPLHHNRKILRRGVDFDCLGLSNRDFFEVVRVEPEET